MVEVSTAGPRFPSAFELIVLKLATAMNSLARVSRRKAQPRSPFLVLLGHPSFLRKGSTLSSCASCRYLVSGSFHPPLGVLFSFPSRYLFAIGLRAYLALEVGASQLPTAIPSHGTLGIEFFLSIYVYGAVTLYGEAFQPTSTSLRGRKNVDARNPTFPET